MTKNKKALTVLFKKRVLQKKKKVYFYANYMAPSYFLNKNSFMFNKFFRKFFYFNFFILKKLGIFAKIFTTTHVFYRFFILEQKKYVFGNCFKFLKNYQISIHDEFFYFFKKSQTKDINSSFYAETSYFRGFHSNLFYLNSDNLVDLPESYEELENFFYKGEIYANWLDPLYSENLNLFLEEFDFEYLFQYNCLFVVEIYRIHIYLISKNLLIILYFYLKKKAHQRA